MHIRYTAIHTHTIMCSAEENAVHKKTVDMKGVHKRCWEEWVRESRGQGEIHLQS